MEPAPTAAQRRKQRIREKEAKKKRQERAELIDGMLIVAFVVAVLAAYFLAWDWAVAIMHRP
jgi:hypothetical protein